MSIIGQQTRLDGTWEPCRGRRGWSIEMRDSGGNVVSWSTTRYRTLTEAQGEADRRNAELVFREHVVEVER